MKKSDVKELSGIIIIILSLAALIIWEAYGREKFNTVEIYVPSHEIESSSIIYIYDLMPEKIDRSAYIDGCITADNVSQLDGKEAAILINKGQMLFASMFKDPEAEKDETTFLIPEKWIYSRVSSIKAGDEAVFYLIPENMTIGTYRIDKLTDSNEQDCSLYDTPIYNFEIQCSPEDYLLINSYASTYGERFLLIYEENTYGNNNQPARS